MKLNMGNSAIGLEIKQGSNPFPTMPRIGGFSSGPIIDPTPHDDAYHVSITDSPMQMTPYGPPYGEFDKGPDSEE